MTGKLTNIALLIDADNANAKHIGQVVETLEKEGALCERHIFGDWSSPHLSGWNDAVLKHALKQNQQNAYTKTKNATDIALVICAMELLYTKEIDTFAIMSSDSDFTPLVQRLRQAGKTVWGFAGFNASLAFQQACNQCIILHKDTVAKSKTNTESNTQQQTKHRDESDERQSQPTDDQEISATKTLNKYVRNDIKKAISNIATEDGYATLENVHQAITNLGIKPEEYGHQSFAKLITLASGYKMKSINDQLCVVVKAKTKTTKIQKPLTKGQIFGKSMLAFDECIVEGLGLDGHISAAHIGQKLSQKGVDYSPYFKKLHLLLDAIPNLDGKFDETCHNYVYKIFQLPHASPYIPSGTAKKILETLQTLKPKDGLVVADSLLSELRKEKINLKILGFNKSYDCLSAVDGIYVIKKEKDGKTLRYVTGKKEIYDQWQKMPVGATPTATTQAKQTLPESKSAETKDISAAPAVPYTKEQLRACTTLIATIKSAIQESKDTNGKADPEHVFALMAKTINPKDYGYHSCKDIYLAIR